MLLSTSNISKERLVNDTLNKKNIRLTILRLDQIHPEISGNKLFKLHYFLEKALASEGKSILTFGGAYSNHLAATAYACSLCNIPVLGMVRGECPPQLSHTLQECLKNGMQLIYLSRSEFSRHTNTDFLKSLQKQYPDYLIIPEGGYAPEGANGAALINQLIPKDATHICTAIGTATTAAGILKSLQPNQQLIGFPVLKGMTDILERITFLTDSTDLQQQFVIADGYHFGGYAKQTPALIDWMNQLYQQYLLPTDFVYTAKMMYGVFDWINLDRFPTGSHIVAVHTGGLQGNLSLPKDSLIF